MNDDNRRPAKGRPRGGSGTNNSKKTLPAVPRRSPDAVFHRIHYDFHGSGVNPISSCPFLQIKKKEKQICSSKRILEVFLRQSEGLCKIDD